MLNVIEIILELDQGIVHRGHIPVIDLGPTGDAGLDHVARLKFRDLFDQTFDKLWTLRARPDQAPFPFANIPKLGHLIQSAFARKLSNEFHARIFLL